MSIFIQTQRSEFFKELTKEKQEMFFNLKQNNVYPAIDNLYFSVFLVDDAKNTDTYNATLARLQPLFEAIAVAKEEANITNEPAPFTHGLTLELKSFKRYNLCLSQADLYDIFFIQSLPNEDTPRIVVQLRAMGLHTRGVDNIVIEAFHKVEQLLATYGLKIEKCRENRIDYAYHTNVISSPTKIFREVGGEIRNCHTSMKDFYMHGDVERTKTGITVHKDYVCIGSKNSNSVRARVYDKVKEVIEMGYKAFFFELWYEKGLISYYDKWCMEYAFLHKNVDYLAKARLEFYTQHGTDAARRNEYEKVLNNPHYSLRDYKRLADDFMPSTTAVINIEYETKRKFYYYSDNFIDALKIDWTRENVVPEQLKRIYRILDNRRIFHNHLVSEKLAFYKGEFAGDKTEWLPWWKRIVNVKLDGIETDEKLLREYTQTMDKKAVQKGAINRIASAAVYDDKVDTGFVEDLSDLLADVSDNEKHKSGLRFVDTAGNSVGNVSGELVRRYDVLKSKKETQLKNRKKRRAMNDTATSPRLVHT